MKYIVIRNNKNLSEYEKGEENYYKPVIFGVTIIFNAKVTLIEIKQYHLKNVLIKLHHIQKPS